jgi:hypothetical protein
MPDALLKRRRLCRNATEIGFRRTTFFKKTILRRPVEEAPWQVLMTW